MGFGRQRARRARPFALGARRPAGRRHRGTSVGRALVAVSFAALLSIPLSSCRAALDTARAEAFAASLASLDSAIDSRDIPKIEKAFSLSFRKSREASDWLSILKRARAAEAIGDSERYARAADRARKAFPSSEPIAAVSALAYMRGGRAADALSLFSGPISPDARPSLWAEAFLATLANPIRPKPGERPVAKPGDYARLADATGDPRPFLGAAALALAAGDLPSARAWLRKAMAGGAAVPPELFWDSGLYQELADMPELGTSAYELALMGDAAWMSGDSSLAKRRWARSIALEPRRSWKPYVDLALMNGDAGEAANSYWARMKAAFLSGPPSSLRDGALTAYAAELARKGRDAEALRALAGGGSRVGNGTSPGIAVLALTIEGKSMPEARLAARFESLAASMPDDALVQGAALRALSLHGLYGELALLREASSKRRLPVANGWYYDAMLAAARDDYKGATATIEAATGGVTGANSGAAGFYALGTLYAAMGDAARSVAAFSRAASAARGGVERCAAFKALGRALGAAGDPAGAAQAYKSASSADPSDPEAAILARTMTDAGRTTMDAGRAGLRAGASGAAGQQ